MKIEYEGINPTGDIQYSLIPLLQEERDGWTGLDRDTTRDWYVRPTRTRQSVGNTSSIRTPLTAFLVMMTTTRCAVPHQW